MSPPVCKVSIVSPAFEEEEVLPRFHAALCAVLAGLDRRYEVEIIYVDDGSRDGTLDVLRRLAAADPRVHYLSLSRNFGVQAALTAGLEYARGDAVITLDSDLQHPPALIPELLQRWHEGHDVVLTHRADEPSLSPFRRMTTRAFYRVMGWLSETEVRPTISDYRLLSRRAVECLLRLRETHRFLRGMVQWVGFRTATVTFTPPSRGGGVSKFTLRRLVALAGDALLSFSKVPLRLALGLGAVSLALGLADVAWAVLHGLLASAPTPWGYHVLLATMLLLGGCILCSVGIVGEYVGRVYEQVKARPLYLLKEASPQLLAVPASLDGPAGRAAA